MKDYDTRLAYWRGTELSPRAQNCLVHEEIDDVEALLGYSDAALGRIPNLGHVTVREIKEWLSKRLVPISRAVRLASDEELLVELHRRIKGNR
jgi:DNA-directed RNA polymerase alpha subunit